MTDHPTQTGERLRIPLDYRCVRCREIVVPGVDGFACWDRRTHMHHWTACRAGGAKHEQGGSDDSTKR